MKNLLSEVDQLIDTPAASSEARMRRVCENINPDLFGELRSILEQPRPNSYYKIGQLISDSGVSDDIIDDEIAPYVESKLKKWPDFLKSLPLRYIFAGMSNRKSLGGAAKVLIDNARAVNGDQLEFYEESHMIFGQEFKTNLNQDSIRNTITHPAIANSKFTAMVCTGCPFSPFEHDDVTNVLVRIAPNLKRLHWGVRSEDVESRNKGTLYKLANDKSLAPIANIDRLHIPINYSDLDILLAHVRSLLENGYNFQSMRLLTFMSWDLHDDLNASLAQLTREFGKGQTITVP